MLKLKMEKFEKIIGKGHHILDSIKSRGFTIPSEIQEKTIPVILEGKDVIAGAATGSGKTLAFAAGLIHNIKPESGLQGLVLTPTRELAEQITHQIRDFSKSKKLNVISIYGGVSIDNQIRNLKTTNIVIGTPGRILDHINRLSIDLSKINTLVLDEADRMLDMGFREDVEKIINQCPLKRQSLLFSATISPDIVRLSKKYLRDPVELSAEEYVDPSKLKQIYYDIENGLKYSLLKHLLENEKAKLVMIFCNTRKNVDFIYKNLRFSGIETLPIHGGFSQAKRNEIIKKFHSQTTQVLVATDVAARGLDIKGVSHIYNYDIPKTKKEYIHRIGRTARAGKQGKVINLVSNRDYENFDNLMTDEFKIEKIETPFIKRSKIRWMPNRMKRGEQRDKRNNNRFGRDNRRRGDRPSRSNNRHSRDNKHRPRRDNKSRNRNYRRR